MNLDRMGQWIAILANVGVLVGFILVAYQLRLNTEALVTASAHKTVELLSNSDAALMGDTGYVAFAKALDEPASITREELVQLWAYFSLSTFAATQVHADYQRGIIPDEQWLAARETFVSYVNHPVGLLWWKTTMADQFQSPESRAFLEAIEEGFEKAPENATQHQFRAWLRAVGELAGGGEPDA